MGCEDVLSHDGPGDGLGQVEVGPGVAELPLDDHDQLVAEGLVGERPAHRIHVVEGEVSRRSERLK